MGSLIDLKGKVFGRWLILRQGKSEGKPVWVCKCECGTVKTVAGSVLRMGQSTSCGCYKNEASAERLRKTAFKHGKTKTPEYFRWLNMNARCLQKNHPAYPAYGGRGIKVCRRWSDSFEAFLEDVGRRPSPRHSIERIDNDGDYKPGNVKWATRRDQANNRRNSVRLTVNGETKTLAEWCKHDRTKQARVRYRLKHGWDAETALS